jgi:hypothetical protein
LGNLVGLMFRGPFVIQLVIAAALVWFGMTVQRDEAAVQAARVALQAAAPPALVDVAAFRAEAGSKLPQEMNIRATLAVDQNVRLVRKKNGITTGESLLFVLMDADAGDDARVARAGIVIDPDDLDKVAAYLMASTVDFRGDRPVVEIGGLVRRPSEASHAKTAMRDNGLTVAPEFFFIEPFVAGRAATLATTAPGNGTVPMVLFGFAAMFGLIALKKLMSGRAAAKAPARELVASRSMLDAPSPFVSPVPVARASAPMRWLRRLVMGVVLLAGLAGIAWLKLFNMYFESTGKALTLDEVWTGLAGSLSSDVAQGLGMVLMSFAGMALVLGLMVWRVLRVFGLVGRRKVAKEAPLPVMARAGMPQSGLAQATPAAAPVSKLPAWAMVQPKAAQAPAEVPAPAAAPAPVALRPTPAIVSKRKEAGPIRPGFSLRDLIPARKVAIKGPDPFDRLAAQVRAEREREALRHGRLHPAE